MTMAMFRLS